LTERVFEQRLADLASWKDTFGTCHVPRTAADAASMSTWVTAVRKAGQKQQGKRGGQGLTEQQRQQLDELGFVWKPDTVSISSNISSELLKLKFGAKLLS
jgi:hypothetical protein